MKSQPQTITALEALASHACVRAYTDHVAVANARRAHAHAKKTGARGAYARALRNISSKVEA